MWGIEPQKLLAKGICENNIDLVQSALWGGADPNKQCDYEKEDRKFYERKLRITPIVQAAVVGSLEITKLLIEKGADPNKAQGNGESALLIAANNGNLRITQYLLENGANPNTRNRFGTPLANAQGIETMRLLLENGADPNIPDQDGDLPIIGSLGQNALEEIKLLIQYGIDLSHKNNNGYTALDYARMTGKREAVEILEHPERYLTDDEPKQNQGPDIYYLVEGIPYKNGVPIKTHKQRSEANDKASSLQDKNQEKANGQNAQKPLALFTACEEGDFDRALSLLKAGADPNETSAEGKTPLFYCDEVALVCLLIHYGADVNATDDTGNTPIFKFITGDNANANSERAVIALIEAGANVDIENDDGVTPRSLLEEVTDYGIRSTFEEGLEIVERKKTARREDINRQEQKRIDWRKRDEPTEEKQTRIETIIDCFKACELSDIEVLRAHEGFVKDNISITFTDGSVNNQSMLMMACECASADIVEYLISLGADVNQVDDTGQAPLRYAAVARHDIDEKIDLLIEAGADIDHTSNDGSAALSDAAFHQNVIAAKALIKHGADVNHRDSNGYTALSWTCGRGAPEADIVELLLRSGANVSDLYKMNCVLEHIDYKNTDQFGLPRKLLIKEHELKERYLYEHTLVPTRVTRQGMQKLREQGFYN